MSRKVASNKKKQIFGKNRFLNKGRKTLKVTVLSKN